MIKYRPHRGGLDEAMKECKEFSDIAEMLKHIEISQNGYIDRRDIVIDKSYGEDERIGWKSWRYVCVTKTKDKKYDTPICIGMCDLGEMD